MDRNIDPPQTAGPYGNGAQSLAKESKFGIAVQWVLSVAALGALGWLQNLDLSTWSGWWAATAVTAVTALIGLLTAYVKKNR